MIVLGADMHKRSHTIAAVAAGTGELVGEQTVQVGKRGFAAVLAWARRLGDDRVWALEDCRHVSGAFERFLLGRGERVIRVAARLTAAERCNGRDRGKSDLIDAVAVARAALREGLGPTIAPTEARRVAAFARVAEAAAIRCCAPSSWSNCARSASTRRLSASAAASLLADRSPRLAAAISGTEYRSM